MPKFIDLAGREVGKWTVLYRDENKGPGTWWVCRCDPKRGGCGQEYAVNALLLRRTLNGLPEGSSQCRACSGMGRKNKLGKKHSAESRQRQSAVMKEAVKDPHIMARLRANMRRAQVYRHPEQEPKVRRCPKCGAPVEGKGKVYCCPEHRPSYKPPVKE